MLKSLFGRTAPRRVFVLGLDCAPPDLLFDTFREDMPNLSALVDSGTWGTLNSSVPCITVPAWSSMTSSQDPGTLGFYGFRNRANYSYDALQVADGSAVNAKRIWDYVGDAGRDSLVMGVPQTYPVRPIRGHLVSGFLTPNTGSAFTYPAVLKQEILKHHPSYAFDATGFRTDDKAWLRQRISDVTAVQFEALTRLVRTKSWDFGMFVNMGTDRVHHGFWRYHDPTHRLHEPDSPFRHTIRDYYKQVDAHLGDLLAALDEDVTLMVVSDHGVRRMDGAIAINEWLWRNGWLALKDEPPQGRITRFEDVAVDWANTRAWSTGGYYGRIFMNVDGREPQGMIAAEAYETVRDELAAALAAIPLPDGTPMTHRIFKPADIYQQVNNVAPDLMVYFGDLHWRCVGSFGHGGYYTLENDTGPDDANHAPEGAFLIADPKRRGRGRGHIDAHQLMDIAPTVLHRMGLQVPATMQGRIIAE